MSESAGKLDFLAARLVHAAPARPPTTVLRSTPSVLPAALAETYRAHTECTISQNQMFMRLVLGVKSLCGQGQTSGIKRQMDIFDIPVDHD